MKDKIFTINRLKRNHNLYIQNVFKIVQVTNDIVHAVNHVVFNMLIFIAVKKCCIICPFIQKKKKKKKKKKKGPFSYT